MVFAGTMSPIQFATLLVGDMVKVPPEQMVSDLAAISGVGLTVTVIEKVPPEQDAP